jgi:membrane protein
VRRTEERSQDAQEPPDVAEAPTPMPEPEEPRQAEPTPRSLSKRDYVAIVFRSVKEALDDHLPNLAAALAYSAFLSIPAVLLIALGVFGLVADTSTVDDMLAKLDGKIPSQAITLLEEPMKNLTKSQNGSIWSIAIGAVLAFWTVTGAMSALIWAFNIAYERDETRGFVKLRLTALAMFLCAAIAVALSLALLVFGPFLSEWVGEQLNAETVVSWAWWVAQWPILVVGLLFAFAGLYYLGPNVDHPRWRFLTLGAAIAVVLWLLASGGFAFYASQFGSYNKTWGALGGVVVTLTWLWITGLALTFGAEINAEAERSRELRRGEPAQDEIQAPPKS